SGSQIFLTEYEKYILERNTVVDESKWDWSPAFDEAAKDLVNGGLLVVPERRYATTKPFEIVIKKKDANLKIIGQGKPIFVPKGKMDVISITSDDNTVKKGEVFIDSIGVDGREAGVYLDEPTGSNAILINNVHSAIIKNNYIDSLYGAGIVIKNIETMAMVEDNTVLDTWGFNSIEDEGGGIDNYGDGIYISQTKQASIRRNYVFNNLEVTNNFGRAGIVLEFGVKMCEIENNRVHGYDRNVHIEESDGYHIIKRNTLTGSDLGIITSTQKKQILIEWNSISNEGCPKTMKHIISDRGLIYLFGEGQSNGTEIRNNELKLDGQFKTDVLYRQNGTAGVMFERNQVVCVGERKDIYAFGSMKNTFRKNELKNVGILTLGAGHSNLFEDNILDVELILNENTPAPGNTFKKNKIYNSSGLVKGLIGYNTVTNLIENEIENYEVIIVNDGNTGGEISGNVFKRTKNEAKIVPWVYEPISRTPFHTKTANLFIDEVEKKNNRWVFEGEAYFEGGKKKIHTSQYPKNGEWKVGDEATNTVITELGEVGNKYIIRGWVCITDGTPGVWVEDRIRTGS
ncbi:TPA: right-handed parallel beta-helix repeat-containing protein, partial [Bacillus nitratireducens]